jgi:hypothetical protein
MRVDRTPDERRYLQVRQILDPVDPDSGALVEVDVFGSQVADDVEQGDRAAVAFVIHRLGEEDWVCDLQPGLLSYFAEHGVLNSLALLNCPAEPRPAVGIGNLRFVIAMVEEQAVILGHDQQHRRAPHRPPVAIR